MFTLLTKIDFNIRNLELKLSMQDTKFVNAVTGDERVLRMHIPSCLAATWLKQQNSVNGAVTSGSATFWPIRFAQPLVQSLRVQPPHRVILFVETQVRHCHSHT